MNDTLVSCGVGPEIYFEGPEKKLEVFFTVPPQQPTGFREFAPSVWSDVLADAHCSILHSVGNDYFDAYLLSESSLFVYPHKLILKTCGTTTLLLVLPKLLALASRLGAGLSHVHYSHFRLAAPQLQHFPHTSFAQEEAAVASLLRGHIGPVHAKVVLGGPEPEPAPQDDSPASPKASTAAGMPPTRWYALCAEGNATSPPAPEPPTPSPPPLVDGATPAERAALAAEAAATAAEATAETAVIEIAMEGLAPEVCSVFVEARHAPLAGRALAAAMTRASGVGGLVPHAHVDDWAFEPCGYSMNALAGPYYYTVHVTPEIGFSYASFETNDPSYSSSERLAAILSVFKPAEATLTLTEHRPRESEGLKARSARIAPPEAIYAVANGWESTTLSPLVSVSATSFVRRPEATEHPDLPEHARANDAGGKPLADAETASSASTEVGGASSLASSMLLDSDAAMSTADSDSTANLDEATSDSDNEGVVGGNALKGAREESAVVSADGEAGVIVDEIVAVLPQGEEVEMGRAN